MQFAPLSSVRHRVSVGSPLPFNVRDSDATLLLAAGQLIKTTEQMHALFKRGALVDMAELIAARNHVRHAPPEALPGLWNQCIERLGQTLMEPGRESFQAALDEVSAPVLELIERSSDLAIFQVLRQSPDAMTQYGIHHSVHCAITTLLVARRIGWGDSECQKAFKVALTMNLAMLELQGQLAQQTSEPTLAQSQLIFDHPRLGVQMLEQAGVSDRDWLVAVAEHHEQTDGSGYPRGVDCRNELAALVRRADVYTAKLSGRRGRDAIAADQAGRAMFMQDPGHPMTLALVKEFGVYPPGCFVRLVSGEVGVVIQRGSTVLAPVVAVLAGAGGGNLQEPVRRDTAQREHAIAQVLGAREPRPVLKPEKLMALALV